MTKTLVNRQIFPHPFSRAYWRQALAEFKDVRVLIFAALMIALRIVMKPFKIPIGPSLNITLGFVVNAFGSMIYGPVVAAAAGAVTDTLGALLFPDGPYFFPFIFLEMGGSVIFALFLYRADLTARRIILCRFTIDFLLNIVIQTPVMMLYYDMMLGKYYAPFDLLRIVKNLVMFPIESVILILLLALVVPKVRSFGFTIGSVQRLKLDRKNIILLVCMTFVGAAAVAGYSMYTYTTTSLSASYSGTQRADGNREVTGLVLERHPELAADVTVCVIGSDFPKLFSSEHTRQAVVYQVDLPALEARVASGEEGSPATMEDAMSALFGYSKTPASKDEALQKLGTVTLVTDGTGQVLSWEDDLP